MLTDEMRAEGWIEHGGGPCPVNHTASVIMRNGIKGVAYPFHSRWLWSFRPLDIIAYRPEPRHD